ncbi:MAG: hypothetical protein EVB11_01615 [Winogradskyella sp.]|nr:MAG: hypothetical protein EVB11_01615 [Winogradskyella sp.]
MDLNDIRDNYRNFPDWKIEKIASEEANSLRPEVLDILKAEIKRRNLKSNLINSVDSQTRELTESEFNEYCHILRNRPCPKCNSRTQKINATMVGRVISMLIMTNYEKSLKVACPNCLDEMHNNANLKSALLGWWGFPWGPIQTIRSFIYNSGMKEFNRTEKPNEVFTSFVVSNVGILEKAKTEPEKLTEFINRTNNAI